MKRILTASILLLTILTGCTGEFKERIANLDEQLTKLEAELKQQNETIASLHTILSAYSKKDFITGITQLDNNAGYAIHFSTMGDIVIYHGTDANVPRVGIKRNPSDGNYYWTIQYGNGEVQYIVNAAGDYVSAVGMVPLLKIENGKFYISYDNRATWQYLGEADGTKGDDIFKKISYNDDYVIFETAEEVFKFPTNKLVQNLYQNATTSSQNMTTLSVLINDLEKQAICVVSVSDLVEDSESVGSVVKLSSGDSIIIKNWSGEASPYIAPEKGAADSVYFWAIVSADGSKQWILDGKGNRVAATGVDVAIPTVVPVLDTTDHTYYWNVVAAGDTTLVRDISGNKVACTSNGGELSVFKKIDNSHKDYIVVVLADGSTITIPKIYTIAFSPEALSMKVSTSKVVTYHVYGADSTSEYTLVTQGDLAATLTKDPGNIELGTIKVQTGATFAGNGKVLLLVSAGNGSTKTMTKTIAVAKED
ncbi:MAG: hypothetical protein IK009_05640 [Bacteroidales bacterium]|nr:hypothetical protein [Bacteroidales bacterium]